MVSVKTSKSEKDTCVNEMDNLYTQYVNNSNNRLYFKRHREDIIKNDSMPVFLRKLCLLNPQMYGEAMADRIIYDLNLTRVSKSLKRGDACHTHTGKYFELKFTIITGTNRGINIVQFRPTHVVDYLMVAVADVTKRVPVCSMYVVPYGDVMSDTGKWSPAHGSGLEVFEKRKTIPYDENNELFRKFGAYKKSYSDLVTLFR